MPPRGGGREDSVPDRAYDEVFAVDSGDEEDLSTPESSEAGSPTGAAPAARPQQQRDHHPPQQLHQQREQPKGSDGSTPRGGLGPDSRSRPAHDDDEDSGSTSETGSDQSSDDGPLDEKKGGTAPPAGGYNPADYKHLKVDSAIEELFGYITRYKPHTIELDTSLKPFIPELIPSIGEVDAFLKMPRPDGEPNLLGMTRLDEPTLNPSDPSILDLQLRSLSKNQDLEPMEVRSIENAEKCPKEIENWVKRIDDLNRSKPAPTVQYSRRMPDIEQLMQVWPAEFEEFLQQNPLPDMSDLELDLPSYIRVVASILDVPVYNQITETLHVIFTLYSEFKSNQHFSKTDTAGNFGAADPYNFAPAPNFTQGPSGTHSAAATGGPIYGGPSSESMAPSRAPSPVGQKSMMQRGGASPV